jgi:hypothetical protein
MVLHVRMRSEDKNRARIEYSGVNNKCDGLLDYDKSTKKITVKKRSADEEKASLEWLFGVIHKRLEENKVTEEVTRICVG